MTVGSEAAQPGAPRSLGRRLALAAAAWSAVALVLAAILFVSLFRHSVEGNFDSQLRHLLTSLVGSALSGEGLRADGPPDIGDSRFLPPQSNWYWQIADRAGIVAASPSLIGNELTLPSEPPAAGEIRIRNMTGPDERALRVIEQTVTTESGAPFRVSVAGDAAALSTDISRFAVIVGLATGALALLLAFGTLGLVRYGLAPLRDLRAALRRVRNGSTATLEGAYPTEIAPLVADLNALIASNREIVERSRTHVGNLAHALKTPLAVLQNEARAADTPIARKVAEQSALMRAQVDHHLNRARMAAQVKVIGAVTPVAPAIEGLARVMRKVHSERGIAITTRCEPGLTFRGERQDFEELVGNLLDNACKWANGEVVVTAVAESDGPQPAIRVTIDDDGPGLPPDRRDAALARGGRLDESRPGTGLGLSIVLELTRLYSGRFTLDIAPILGGLRADLTLPAVADG